MKLPDETLRQAESMAGRGNEGAALFRFAGFSLDLGSNSLSRDGAPVPLRPKSLEMLKYLMQRHGETVSKRALAEAIWLTPPADVDASIAQCVKDIRAVLGSDTRGMLQTVPGVGYVFRGQIEKRELPQQPALSQANGVLPAPRRIGWWVRAAVVGLVIAGGIAGGVLFAITPPKDPENVPLAVRESYRYRPNRTIFNTDLVTITTDEGKTIICRGGNDGTRTPRQCWWGKP